MPFRNAISGMRASQVHLETIGNNVANANTSGFKQSRAEFADIYAVNQSGISANAPGNGVNVARVAQQFGQGNLSVTDNVLDLAIDGEGFFTLEDGGTQVYSRAGAFGLDNDGFIVNAQSQRLIGYQPDSAGNISGATGAIQLTTTLTAPRATTDMDVDLNLDANSVQPLNSPIDAADVDSYNNSTSTTIYDSLGNAHLATMYFAKEATANEWSMQLYVDNSATGTPQTLEFDTAGALTTPASGEFSFTQTIAGADPLNFTLNVGESTQYGSAFAVSELSQDGYTTGRLSGLDIDSEGVIYSRFTNGVSQAQGQVAMANFQNAQGLQKLGNNAWAETNASGAALIGEPGSSDLGLVQAGSLEDSNVDLTEQLVDMIVAQRNFQANAQVITTADAITQTVINIR